MIKPWAAVSPVFIRVGKFTYDCTLSFMIGTSASVRSEAMSTQKRELRKNYIGLVSEELEEQRAAEVQSVTDRRMQEYVRGMMATILSRRSEAR